MEAEERKKRKAGGGEKAAAEGDEDSGMEVRRGHTAGFDSAIEDVDVFLTECHKKTNFHNYSEPLIGL